MSKQVEVFAADGSTMTPTFGKRAKQLVKTGRAEWISDNAIRLVEECKESIGMEEYVMDNGQEKTETVAPILDMEPTDEEIYSIAKKRVNDRSELVVHIVSFITVNIFLAQFTDAWIYVFGGWGIGLCCHIASYFSAATPEAIQKEYLKIKRKYYM